MCLVLASACELCISVRLLLEEQKIVHRTVFDREEGFTQQGFLETGPGPLPRLEYRLRMWKDDAPQLWTDPVVCQTKIDKANEIIQKTKELTALLRNFLEHDIEPSQSTSIVS